MLNISCPQLIKFCIAICIVILIGATNQPTHTHTALNISSLFELVQELQKKEILDGTVFVSQGNNILLHEQSRDVAACAQKGEPQFLIGSISKQFTAIALLRALYEVSEENTQEEKCAWVLKQLHNPISFFLPADARVWNGAMPAWADKVTLHHLLTHTASISCSNGKIYECSGFDGVWNWINTQHTVAEIMSIPVQEPLLSEPGKDYAYLNEGYILLGEIVSAISGKSFTDYIENMCKIIGMTNTYHPDCKTWMQINHQSRFASLVPGMVYSGINADISLHNSSPNLIHDFSNTCGSGGIVSTVHDLTQWNNALHKEKTLLPLPLYKQFIKPNLNDYGYGIWNKNGILFHGGGIDSYSSAMLYIPNEDLLIIALHHINYDKTLEKTECAFDTILQKIISAKNVREQFLDKIIGELAEKYFAKRGANLIIRLLMKQCFER